MRNGDKWLALPCSFSHSQKISIQLSVPLYSAGGGWCRVSNVLRQNKQPCLGWKSYNGHDRLASCILLDDVFPGDSQITIIRHLNAPTCLPAHVGTFSPIPTKPAFTYAYIWHELTKSHNSWYWTGRIKGRCSHIPWRGPPYMGLYTKIRVNCQHWEQLNTSSSFMLVYSTSCSTIY